MLTHREVLSRFTMGDDEPKRFKTAFHKMPSSPSDSVDTLPVEAMSIENDSDYVHDMFSPGPSKVQNILGGDTMTPYIACSPIYLFRVGNARLTFSFRGAPRRHLAQMCNNPEATAPLAACVQVVSHEHL